MNPTIEEIEKRFEKFFDLMKQYNELRLEASYCSFKLKEVEKYKVKLSEVLAQQAALGKKIERMLKSMVEGKPTGRKT